VLGIQVGGSLRELGCVPRVPNKQSHTLTDPRGPGIESLSRVFIRALPHWAQPPQQAGTEVVQRPMHLARAKRLRAGICAQSWSCSMHTYQFWVAGTITAKLPVCPMPAAAGDSSDLQYCADSPTICPLGSLVPHCPSWSHLEAAVQLTETARALSRIHARPTELIAAASAQHPPVDKISQHPIHQGPSSQCSTPFPISSLQTSARTSAPDPRT
jgi:hypothetical protein